MVIDVITEWNHFSFLGFLVNGKEFPCKIFYSVFRKKSHFLHSNIESSQAKLMIGLDTHLFVKVPRPGNSEVTF